MDSVHHIWCPLSSQEYQDLPDGAETTLTDIKDPSKEKHNHLERVELRYEKITWTYKDGNIIHSDSWNERATA